MSLQLLQRAESKLLHGDSQSAASVAQQGLACLNNDNNNNNNKTCNNVCRSHLVIVLAQAQFLNSKINEAMETLQKFLRDKQKQKQQDEGEEDDEEQNETESHLAVLLLLSQFGAKSFSSFSTQQEDDEKKLVSMESFRKDFESHLHSFQLEFLLSQSNSSSTTTRRKKSEQEDEKLKLYQMLNTFTACILKPLDKKTSNSTGKRVTDFIESFSALCDFSGFKLEKEEEGEENEQTVFKTENKKNRKVKNSKASEKTQQQQQQQQQSGNNSSTAVSTSSSSFFSSLLPSSIISFVTTQLQRMSSWSWQRKAAAVTSIVLAIVWLVYRTMSQRRPVMKLMSSGGPNPGQTRFLKI